MNTQVSLEGHASRDLHDLHAMDLFTPGVGDSHMEQTGTFFVSPRGVNFGLVSLMVFRAKRQYLSSKVSSRVPRRNTELREEKQFLFILFCLPHYLYDYISKFSTKGREHYNPINQ